MTGPTALLLTLALITVPPAVTISCQRDQRADPEPIAAAESAAKTCTKATCDQVCENGRQMKTTLTAALACFNFLLCSCGPVTPDPVVPVPAVGGSSSTGGASSVGGGSAAGGSGASVEFVACVNLSNLGCPEGANVTKCATDMERRCSNYKVTCDTQCLIDAASKSDAIKCGLACGSL